MKKIFLLSSAIMVCFAMSAQTITRSCKVTMKGVPSGTPDELRIYEVTEATTTDFYDGVEATHMTQNTLPTSVNIYVEQSYGTLSNVALPDITGMPIVIVPNAQETNYSFTFSNVNGSEIKFQDLLLDSTFVVAKDLVYEFTTEAVAEPIKNRFRIFKPGHFEICALFDKVEIHDNEGTDNIVITDMTGAEVVNVAPTGEAIQTIDLSDKAAGHYVLTVNGTQYEFCNKPANKQK